MKFAKKINARLEHMKDSWVWKYRNIKIIGPQQKLSGSYKK